MAKFLRRTHVKSLEPYQPHRCWLRLPHFNGFACRKASQSCSAKNSLPNETLNRSVSYIDQRIRPMNNGGTEMDMYKRTHKACAVLVIKIESIVLSVVGSGFPLFLGVQCRWRRCTSGIWRDRYKLFIGNQSITSWSLEWLRVAVSSPSLSLELAVRCVDRSLTSADLTGKHQVVVLLQWPDGTGHVQPGRVVHEYLMRWHWKR